MPFFHDQGRSSLRRMYVEAWHKHRASLPVEPVEDQIIRVVALHPEYAQLLESGPAALERDYTPEDGQTNPFLHMGLHLAIREQVATDRPAGIAVVHRSDRLICQIVRQQLAQMRALAHRQRQPEQLDEIAVVQIALPIHFRIEDVGV